MRNILNENGKQKNIRRIKKIIEREKPFVDIKPYSHNIISLTLMQISKEFSFKEANKCIKDFNLESLGWKRKNGKTKN